MAKTKQFSITIQNQPGALAAVARTLANGKVNIMGVLAASQGTSATVQVVTEDAKRAKKALDGARIAYQETVAEEQELPQKARCFGAGPGEARRQGHQPEFALCHSRQRWQESSYRLYHGDRSQDGVSVKELG